MCLFNHLFLLNGLFRYFFPPPLCKDAKIMLIPKGNAAAAQVGGGMNATVLFF